MLKSIKHLLKKGLVSNVALALIAIPVPTSSFVENPQTDLTIPQSKLDLAFNVSAKETEAKIQIPIVFTYMSQGYSSFHPGIDLATKYGTPIKPVEAGTVEEAGYSPFGYGNEVVIDNGNGIETLYAHLSKIEVKKGDVVNIDSEVGLVGSTGRSSGPHLHLEIHKEGKPVNPLTILPTLKTDPSFTRLLTSK